MSANADNGNSATVIPTINDLGPGGDLPLGFLPLPLMRAALDLLYDPSAPEVDEAVPPAGVGVGLVPMCDTSSHALVLSAGSDWSVRGTLFYQESSLAKSRSQSP